MDTNPGAVKLLLRRNCLVTGVLFVLSWAVSERRGCHELGSQFVIRFTTKLLLALLVLTVI